jgi:sugar/nucleoside kinase (ribokinase family)
MVDVAGFAVEEIDPTGAGDCFGAAFVSTWLSGARPVEALRIANAAGALAVTRRGPMEGAATLAEIKSFLGRQGAGAAA